MKEPYSFHNIISDQSNSFALAVARILANGDSEMNPIMLYGPSGIGKTHIAFSVSNAFENDNKIVVYTNAQTILEEILEYEGSINELYSQRKNTELLIVENCDYLSGKLSSQELFSQFILSLVKSETQVLIISTLTPDKLPVISKVLFDDNERHCLQVYIGKPSDKLKEQYLFRTVKDLQLSINESLCKKIISECEILPEIHSILSILKFRNLYN